MFAMNSLRFIAAMLVLACGTAPSKAVNMNHVCALVADGTLLATGDSCDSYYVCMSNVATLQTCNSGFYFSKDAQNCVPQAQVNCLSAGQNPCSGRQVGAWVGVPGSCSGYYYCSATGPQMSYCPAGENFDAVTQRCVYNSQMPCGTISTGGSGTPDSAGGSAVTSVNLCSFIKNGMYFGSPSSCDGWSLCTNNVLTSGNCPTNYNYNPQLGKCDYVADVPCTQVTYDPELVGGIASNGGPCTLAEYNQVTKSSSCQNYYWCNGYNYQLLQCSYGNYFDIFSKTCVARNLARNPCDRCVGTTLTFVNEYSTVNCSDYLYCVNGVEAGAAACPLGSFFNEIDGACVFGQDPPFAFCNPNASGVANPSSTTTTTTAAPTPTKAAAPTTTTKTAAAPTTTTTTKTAAAPTTTTTTKTAAAPTTTTKTAAAPTTTTTETAAAPTTTTTTTTTVKP